MEPQIVQVNPSEDTMDQPKAASVSKIPLLKSISVLPTIYKWNPTGIRIVVNLPILGNDRNYLFCIRCSPYIPHLRNDYQWTGNQPFCLALAANHATVVHDHDFGDIISTGSVPTPEFTSDPGVYIFHHSAPPLISDLVRSNRFWTGDLKFRLRTKAAFTHNGILFATPIYGVKTLYANANPTNSRYLIPYRQKFNLQSSMANSYLYNDLTMNRHMEMQYTYCKPFNYVDQFGLMANTAQYSVNALTLAEGFYNTAVTNYVEDFIGIAVKGDIDNSSTGDNQVMFELDIAAGENFKVGGETAFPTSAADDLFAKSSSTGDGFYPFGDSVPINTNILPRQYLNPQFVTGTTPQFAFDATTGHLNVNSVPYVVT